MDDGGDAVLVQEADQGLADTELGQSGLGVKGRIHAEALGRGGDGLLLGRGVGAQGVLDAVGELGQDIVGDVGGALRDKIDADTLRADQLDHLDNFLDQGFRAVAEEQMRLVKEEDHAGFGKVADLRQLFKQLGHHPEQEGRIDGRTLNQAPGGQNVDIASAFGAGAHPVMDVERRLTEKELSPLLLELEQGTLDGADGGGGDVAVHGGELFAVIADKLQHRTQVLQVKQQKTVVIGHTEDDIENTLLNLGQAEEPRQKRRAHLGDRDTYGKADLAENIPEPGREGFKGKVLLQAEAHNALLHVFRVLAGHAHARKIALDVREEHGHAHIGKRLSHDLHGNGFTGPGRAGDQPMAVGHLGKQEKLFLTGFCKIYFSVSVHKNSPICRKLYLGVCRGCTPDILNTLYHSFVSKTTKKSALCGCRA